MPHYVDIKYINLLSPYLQRFKQKNENLWNFRCHYCGDSEKNKIKARGYIFFNKEVYLFKCQNCGYSTNLFELIKSIDKSLYKSYVLESFSHKMMKKPSVDIKKVSDVIYNRNALYINTIIDPVSSLPDYHFVVNYIKYRKIPVPFWDHLYYTSDYKLFVDEIYPNHGKELVENDQRLVIPFYDENNELVGFQGRTLSGNKAKYITILLEGETLKLYGLERVKKDQLIQVVEGPIDSMFLSNAVATCDFDLCRAAKYLSKENLLLIWDNQYQNKDIRRSISAAIDNGFSVCLFPKSIKYKDINEMVINDMTIEEVNTVIQENTFSGLRARLELNDR